MRSLIARSVVGLSLLSPALGGAYIYLESRASSSDVAGVRAAVNTCATDRTTDRDRLFGSPEKPGELAALRAQQKALLRELVIVRAAASAYERDRTKKAAWGEQIGTRFDSILASDPNATPASAAESLRGVAPP